MQLTNLKCNFVGKNFSFYKKIDSTQAEIWRRIKSQTIKNGELVMADIQTQAKGTHGRVWYTDESGNIAFSLYVEMNTNVKKIEGITYKIAEIVNEIFKEKYNINLKIKLPNDIVFNNKKIGGILTETKVSKEIVKYMVVGIGINTNKMNFTDDIKNIATSLKKEFNITVKSEDFVCEFCNKFEKSILQITEKTT